jgi:hypothetical protein
VSWDPVYLTESSSASVGLRGSGELDSRQSGGYLLSKLGQKGEERMGSEGGVRLGRYWLGRVTEWGGFVSKIMRACYSEEGDDTDNRVPLVGAKKGGERESRGLKGLAGPVGHPGQPSWAA